MAKIHPTAIVDPKAELADDVEIQPYAIIEGHVVLGPGVVIHSHTVLKGHTVIGAGCRIGPAAYVGLDPQHLSNAGVGTSLYIGDGTIIRETATLHRSTRPGPEHATRIGARCFIMAAAHVGHDSKIGDDVVMANATLLGGHVTIGDKAFLGGMAGIHQHCRIGRLAIIAGTEQVTRDVLPFAAVRYGGLKGYNAIGCRRAGMSRDAIHALRAAFRCFHTYRTTPAAVAAIERTVPLLDEVREMICFVTASKRGLHPSVRFVGAPEPFTEAE